MAGTCLLPEFVQNVLRGVPFNGIEKSIAIDGNGETSSNIRRAVAVERVAGGGEILGAASAALQLVAVRRGHDLACEDLAAFPASDDDRVAGNHDGAGAAGERLLLRGIPCGDSDPERHDQYIVEPAAMGDLGRGDAIRDIV